MRHLDLICIIAVFRNIGRYWHVFSYQLQIKKRGVIGVVYTKPGLNPKSYTL